MKFNQPPLDFFGQSAHERVKNAVVAITEGKPVILVDDESRENEGDLIVAAQRITPKSINFMIRNCTGIICLSLTEQRLNELEIPMMVPNNGDALSPAFTVTIDAKVGIASGVSAADRAKTIQLAIDPKTKPSDLARPGHIFPLKAKNGGVLSRPGHTEGSIDLAQLAGLQPAAVLCELINPDGTMSRLPQLVNFARKMELTLLSILDIIDFRKSRTKLNF